MAGVDIIAIAACWLLTGVLGIVSAVRLEALNAGNAGGGSRV